NVENYLGFAVGTIVPDGYYDRKSGVWVPSDNGVVLRILSITNGTADIDLTGDGSPESAAALTAAGIDAAEQQKLATLYGAGQTMWRFPVTHFSPFDGNWLASPIEITPGDAVTPHQPQPATNPEPST